MAEPDPPPTRQSVRGTTATVYRMRPAVIVIGACGVLFVGWVVTDSLLEGFWRSRRRPQQLRDELVQVAAEVVLVAEARRIASHPSATGRHLELLSEIVGDDL